MLIVFIVHSMVCADRNAAGTWYNIMAFIYNSSWKVLMSPVLAESKNAWPQKQAEMLLAADQPQNESERPNVSLHKNPALTD